MTSVGLFNNRRHFMKSCSWMAGAAALPTIISTRALGLGNDIAPSNKITVGCIGVGGMGVSNMKKFLELKDAQVVAVCDVSLDKRANAKRLVDEKYGDSGCESIEDFRELLTRTDIDAVSIAAPDHWNAFIAVAAARAGKDMYCEKPMGVSLDQGQAIRKAVREGNRVFQAGTWQRSQAHFRQACEIARNGYLGKIHTVEVSTDGPQFKAGYKGPKTVQPTPPIPDGFNWKLWQGPAPDREYHPALHSGDWFLINDYSNGFIVNWGVHHLDIALWGLPELGTQPFDVECLATYRQEGFTDNVNQWNATFTYRNGLKLIFKDQYQMKTGCRFYGENGWVHTDRPGIEGAPNSNLKIELKSSDQSLYKSDHHQGNFIDCVRTRKDPISDVDATLTASYMGMLADVAARLKTKLTWDPKAERFVDHDVANSMLNRPAHNGWSLT